MVILWSFQRVLRVIRPQASNDVQKDDELDRMYMDDTNTAWSVGEMGTDFSFAKYNNSVSVVRVGRQMYNALCQRILANEYGYAKRHSKSINLLI